MVVKEDGTKWACASCLKGHRVSGCTHVERELTFVPKKGRPITQCPHCRAERKKRSAHIKCDCGDKPPPKEKCIHLREAEAKAAALAAAAATAPANGSTTTGSTSPEAVEHHTPPHFDLVPLPEESIEDDHHCCCPHGGKCTCATVKKDASEDVHEIAPKLPHHRPKHRLTSHQSEGHLTIFANGHHKPVHRNNHAAHECGVPYKLPRSHTGGRVHSMARRSVDSLASAKSLSPVTWLQQSTASSMSPPQEQPVAKVERDSPQSDHSMSQPAVFNTRMSIDANSYVAPEPSSSVASVSNTVFQDFGFPSSTSALSIATTSTEPSMSAYSMPTSAMDYGTSAPDFWTNIDWSKLDGSSLDTQPALTNASSGTISEIDDLPPVDDLCAFDTQYSIEGHTRFDFDNSMSSNHNHMNNTNNNASYNGGFNPSNNITSNRWSMPVFPSQSSSNALFPIMSGAESSVKEMPSQSFGMTQPSLDSQMTSGVSSVQSHSPATDNIFQGKGGDMSSFDWDALIPDYSTSVVGNNDASMTFDVGEPNQNVVSCVQSSNVASTSNNYDGFDNGFRTMQWDDGVSIPADQDYVNSFNFEPNWPTGSFNPWS